MSGWCGEGNKGIVLFFAEEEHFTLGKGHHHSAPGAGIWSGNRGPFNSETGDHLFFFERDHLVLRKRATRSWETGPLVLGRGDHCILGRKGTI